MSRGLLETNTCSHHQLNMALCVGVLVPSHQARLVPRSILWQVPGVLCVTDPWLLKVNVSYINYLGMLCELRWAKLTSPYCLRMLCINFGCMTHAQIVSNSRLFEKSQPTWYGFEVDSHHPLKTRFYVKIQGIIAWRHGLQLQNPSQHQITV